MRYNEEKQPAFYIEEVNEWNKHQTCHNLTNKYICGQDVPILYYPEKQRKGASKKKKGKKNAQLVRTKNYDKPAQKTIRYWNDLSGKKIDPIKQQNLNWPDWPKTRLSKKYLPCNIRPTFIKILQGQPAPLPFALLPVNLAQVRTIIKEDKIAEKLAKKLAKEQKAAAILAKQIARQKGKKV